MVQAVRICCFGVLPEAEQSKAALKAHYLEYLHML